jgi:molecular chaperone GrpE (heat shock protein)
MHEPNFTFFGVVLWFFVTAFLLKRFGKSSDSKQPVLAAQIKEIEQLKQQCQRSRQELQQQSIQLKADFKDTTFEQLQTLLTNFPTARLMAESKPDLPAKNLLALLTPLENMLSSWGYKTIGKPWEQVSYNPQLHQPDSDDITEGELVYIRFVGYQNEEKIITPAKVSRTLPTSIKNE